MRVFIASDIHGSATAMAALAEHIKEFDPDRIILLGDLLYHGPRNDLPDGYAPKHVIPLLNEHKNIIRAVRGNCEAEVDQMVLDFPCMADYVELELNGLRTLATHGHLFNTPHIPDLAGFDIVMSGHTHIKVLKRDEQGVIHLNPGSASIPKDGSASYATYENGTIALRDMSGGIIKSLVL